MIIRNRTRQVLARSAFTLMEMLVVVAIIIALAGIGGYYFLQQAQNARVNTAKAQIAVLEKAVDTYRLDNGTPPPSLEALYMQAPKGGPYLNDRKALADPWGQPYMYDPNGSQNMQHGNQGKVDIWSVGSGTPVGNWN